MEDSKAPIKTPKSSKKTPIKVITPKLSKKTPKKVVTPELGKQSLKQISTPKSGKKTPKEVFTPKSGKKTPKEVFTPKSVKKTPKEVITPKSVKKTPKEVITPKSVKKTSKEIISPKLIVKTPKTKVKTPESKPNSPKTLQMGSEKKQRNIVNKKQKLSNNTSREIKNKVKDEVNSKKDYLTMNMLLPAGYNLVEDVLPIFEGCDAVKFSSNLGIKLSYNPENAAAQIQKLRKTTIRGKLLKIDNKGIVHIFKRTLKLPNVKHKAAAKKFFNAKSIEQIFTYRGYETNNWVLSFETEESAKAASKKVFELEGKSYMLSKFYDRASTLLDTNGLNGEEEVKGAKNKRKSIGDKKLKKQIPKPVKRKAEEVED